MSDLKENRRQPTRRTGDLVAVIDSRTLERECFVRGVRAVEPKTQVAAFASVTEWIEQDGAQSGATAVLYNVEGRRIADPAVSAALARLERSAGSVPVVVLSPFEDLSEMLLALDCGAHGYIPASLGIEAALVAIRLILAGGIFLPTGSVGALREALAATRSVPVAASQFTARQAAVAEALRRGKSNKLIAYELNMCESTVKVHIRNIMKKLHATNRTEAGFKLSTLLMIPGAQVRILPDSDDGDGETETLPAPRPIQPAITRILQS